MGVVQRRGDVHADPDREPQIEVPVLALPAQELLDAGSLDELLHHVGDPLVLPGLLDLSDVRVIQQRPELTLVEEHLSVGRVVQLVGLERLDHDEPGAAVPGGLSAQPGVGHAPLAEPRDYLILTDEVGSTGLSLGWRHWVTPLG